MSFYLSNADTGPTGLEPAEFLDLPSLADRRLPPAVVIGPTLGSSSPSDAKRAYVGPGITVHWDPERCIHAERCTSGAPEVFDRAARPWVSPAGATAAEIAAVIDTCPSGALSYTRTDGIPNGRRGRTATDDPTRSTAADPELSFFAPVRPPRPVEVPVTITPQRDGPLVIGGTVALRHPDGSTELAGRLALCRCGRSGSKPKCDGTHARWVSTPPVCSRSHHLETEDDP